jgi:hypothetical protein
VGDTALANPDETGMVEATLGPVAELPAAPLEGQRPGPPPVEELLGKHRGIPTPVDGLESPSQTQLTGRGRGHGAGRHVQEGDAGDLQDGLVGSVMPVESQPKEAVAIHIAALIAGDLKPPPGFDPCTP